MHILALLLLTLSYVWAPNQVPQTANQQVAFVDADMVGEAKSRHFFVFTSSARRYAIRNDGRSEGAASPAQRKTFHLQMGGSSNVKRVYFAEFEGDLFLEYEVTSARGNLGYVLRMDQKTMKYKWLALVNAENLGPGLIDNHELYFSGSNLLAKLDLQDGTYAWQSELQRFFTFTAPTIKGDKVVFHDESEGERVVEVEKETGRLLKS